ncbi:MAG: DUF1810 domain-containing protein [Noviherbaspirillum sp.]
MDQDIYQLQRFVDAQAPVYLQARAELGAGRKTSHWMWFIFPQMRGLGRSAMAQHYGIASLDEARAYLAHPALGARLRDCCELVLALQGRSAHQIFGSPDDSKFRSSLTLFGRAAPEEAVFSACLRKYFDGVEDQATLDLIA